MIKLENYLRKHKTEVRITESTKIKQALQAVKYTVGDLGETFAFVAYPETEMPQGGFPAILLIHGGDGKAFSEWAELWAKRGYVAIAPDFCAQEEKDGIVKHNERGGPLGYGSITDFNTDNPWAYYSTLSAISALDVLCAKQCVNSEKIGVQGISWGGFLSLITCGMDTRPRVLSVVYSSAFISDSQWGKDRGIKDYSAEKLQFYNNNIDPQSYLKNIQCPIIFSAGCNDTAFSMKNRMLTASSISTKKAFSFRLNYIHTHEDGWKEEEPTAFFDSVLNSKSFPVIRIELKGKEINIANADEFTNLKLLYTIENLELKDVCEWIELPICSKSVLPNDALSWFVFGETDTGLKISTQVF